MNDSQLSLSQHTKGIVEIPSLDVRGATVLVVEDNVSNFVLIARL
jgi:hypothetical protein